MKFGLVGNNDGPLYLLKGLYESSFQPQFVGLQNSVSADLETLYTNKKNKAVFFQEFEEQKLLEKLEVFDLDLLINCFCNFRFDEILTLPFPVLNVHLSPLPAYRGRHPLQWALINGEEEFGFSIHKMTATFDAGEIYRQEMVPVKNGMSVQQLRTRLMKKLQACFADFLHEYEKGIINPVANNDDEASYVPRRYPEDSKLTEWNDSQMIYRKVQGLRSENYPAYIDTGTLQVPCFEASLGIKIDNDLHHPFIFELQKNKFLVACPDGQTVWLTCLPDRLKYLSLGQRLDQQKNT